jgi:hypothetical protein
VKAPHCQYAGGASHDLGKLHSHKSLFANWRTIGLKAADEANLICLGVGLVQSLDLHAKGVGNPVVLEVSEHSDLLAGCERVRRPFRGRHWLSEDAVGFAMLGASPNGCPRHRAHDGGGEWFRLPYVMT